MWDSRLVGHLDNHEMEDRVDIGLTRKRTEVEKRSFWLRLENENSGTAGSEARTFSEAITNENRQLLGPFLFLSVPSSRIINQPTIIDNSLLESSKEYVVTNHYSPPTTKASSPCRRSGVDCAYSVHLSPRPSPALYFRTPPTDQRSESIRYDSLVQRGRNRSHGRTKSIFPEGYWFFVGNKAICHTATPTLREWRKIKNLQADGQPRSGESGMFSRSIRDLSRLGSELS
jgi:hypothetical protein